MAQRPGGESAGPREVELFTGVPWGLPATEATEGGLEEKQGREISLFFIEESKHFLQASVLPSNAYGEFIS